MYSLDWMSLLCQLMPNAYGNVRLLRLIVSHGYNELAYIHAAMTDRRSTVMYDLSITPQVCRLRKVLNDMYDPVNRGILINDGVFSNRIYLYARQTNRPVYLKRYIDGREAYADSGVDFTVSLPLDVAIDESTYNRLIATLKRFKLVGKRYRIVRI